MKTVQAKDLLNKSGVKPSLHRIKILEYLMEKKNHPTVDQIYSDIISDIPTLSKTTIYNTLKAFLDNGVVQTITIEENEARYDADISNHAHFKCKKCGRIYDIFINPKVFSMKSTEGHRIDEVQLYFMGICKNCK